MTLTHGYDVSAYQPSSPVPLAAFGWVKTSEGDGYKNSKFKAQWDSAQKNWEVPGVYHYAHPEQSSALTQVRMIESMVRLIAGKHTVMLDLEASRLTQAKTNAWARDFGETLWTRMPGVKTVLYMGGGYATNGTGKGLADFFDYWCFPQYPSAYRLGTNPLYSFPNIRTMDAARAINRSHEDPRRFLLSAPKSNWPTSMDQMTLPPGAKQNTGFEDVDFWQFTDNHYPGGVDASVTPMTVAQILGANNDTGKVNEEMQSGVFDKPRGTKFGFPFQTGAYHQMGLYLDNTLTDSAHEATAPAKLRVAFLRSDGTYQTEHVTVGRATDKDKAAVTYVVFDSPKTTRAVSIIREDDETAPIGFMLD